MNQIQVTVCDPIVKDGVKKYILYTIRGTDRVSNFEVLRRYNDFNILRQNLLARWPGCYIPPIPPKKAVGNMDPKFIENRRKYLNTFCQELALLPYIWYGEEFDIFIRSSNPELSQTFDALPNQDAPKLIEKYEAAFSHLSGVSYRSFYIHKKKEINQAISIKIIQFQNFLKRVEPLLENYKIMAANINDNKISYNQQIQTMLEYLLPEYEQFCLNEYVQKKEQNTIFQTQAGKQILQNFKAIFTINNFFEAFDLLQDELIEIEVEKNLKNYFLFQAFQEIYNGKAKYDQKKSVLLQSLKDLEDDIGKLKTGKQIIRLTFDSKEKAIQKLEQQIEETKKEIESLQFLCDLMMLIIGYDEIDKFKRNKEIKYYTMLKNICKSEIEQAKQVYYLLIQIPTLSLKHIGRKYQIMIT